jgi:hypothetical protein
MLGAVIPIVDQKEVPLPFLPLKIRSVRASGSS